MKSLISVSILIMFSMTFSCSQPGKPTNPEKWSEKELSEWFSKGEWKSGWKAIPDGSINQKELAIQYFRNPERWEKAFNFLKSERLDTLAPGIYELGGKNVYAIVQEYNTKTEEMSRFEAHRQYADIQHMISGEERIGVLPLDFTTVAEPYDSIKDIVFLTADTNHFRLSSPERFFVLFPGDAHRPGVETGTIAGVKKIVVKVKVDENR